VSSWSGKRASPPSTSTTDSRWTPRATWSQAQDGRCAVRWLAANAATYDVDINRVAVAGDSAGGQLDPKFDINFCQLLRKADASSKVLKNDAALKNSLLRKRRAETPTQSCSSATFNCAGDCGDVVP